MAMEIQSKKLWKMAGLLTLSAALLSGCGKPKAEQAEAEVEDVLEETDDTGDYRTVTWQGTTYKYNDHLSNFLFWAWIPGKRQRPRRAARTQGSQTPCIS